MEAGWGNPGPWGQRQVMGKTEGSAIRRSCNHPLVPAKAETQFLALDSRLRGNERSMIQ